MERSDHPGTRFPDFRLSGYPDVWISGYPDIRKSGYPTFQKQCQTIGNGSKINEIMKIVEKGPTGLGI